MKDTLKSILIRLKNPGTIMAIVGCVLVILNELGYCVDNEQVTTIVEAMSYILIVLGILNDGTSDDMYIPFLKDKYVNKKIKQPEDTKNE